MIFFKIAPQVPVRTAVHPFPLAQADEVLDRLRSGKIERRCADSVKILRILFKAAGSPHSSHHQNNRDVIRLFSPSRLLLHHRIRA